MRVKIRNRETILLKVGNFMLKLESSSCVILIVDFLQLSPHLGCSLEGSKIENNGGINRGDNPGHDLSILNDPLGILFLVDGFVRSGVAAINMTPQILTGDKYLELKCPG